jgi:hypothetical protein
VAPGEPDSALSGSGWLADRSTTAEPVFRARVRSGALLRQLPSAAGPVREGRLSPVRMAGMVAYSASKAAWSRR